MPTCSYGVCGLSVCGLIIIKLGQLTDWEIIKENYVDIADIKMMSLYVLSSNLGLKLASLIFRYPRNVVDHR